MPMCPHPAASWVQPVSSYETPVEREAPSLSVEVLGRGTCPINSASLQSAALLPEPVLLSG